MSEFQRLAKEDYELMGRASIWTDFNAVTMLASYEMEVSGAFGESKELFQFNRLAFRSAQGLEKAFHEKWSKWFNFVSDAIANGDILYANTPERGAPPADSDATTVQVVGNCTFEPKELITSISKAVATGNVTFHMESFISFLLGNGSAPARSLSSRKSRMYAAAKASVKSEKKSKKSERGKAGSDATWAEHRETKVMIRQYALKVDGEGCTCNHAQLALEIHEYARDEKGNALLGGSEMSLEVVKETVKDLFKEKGIRRIKGSDVFKDETACKVHHPDEYEHHKQKRSR